LSRSRGGKALIKDKDQISEKAPYPVILLICISIAKLKTILQFTFSMQQFIGIIGK
jgi:hypothetical protein